VRRNLEFKLREHGINCPSYHGNNLTRVKVKVLLQKIDIIFDEFHTIILDCEHRKANDVEVFTVVSIKSLDICWMGCLLLQGHHMGR
jgi:hypothetical protein